MDVTTHIVAKVMQPTSTAYLPEHAVTNGTAIITFPPNHVPPLFVAAATADQLGLAPDSVNLYGKWIARGEPAEIHIYSKGGHGFGMRKQNLSSDRLIRLWGMAHGSGHA